MKKNRYWLKKYVFSALPVMLSVLALYAGQLNARDGSVADLTAFTARRVPVPGILTLIIPVIFVGLLSANEFGTHFSGAGR